MKVTLNMLVICVVAVSAYSQTTKTTQANPLLQGLLTQKKSVPIKPLSPSLKMNLVKSLLRNRPSPQKLESASLAPSVTLSVANPVSNGSFLKFSLPFFVSPSANIAEFKASNSQPNAGVMIFFKAPVEGTYALDFATTGVDGGSLSSIIWNCSAAFGSTQAFTLNQTEGHTIFLAESPAGLNVFQLNGDKANWDFQSVEISQFKMGN